ncbi:MAG TPA: c-type cytochrome [Bryobacteraceae bacterium]|nr:c-type cytochrome [Bryobacteraceae bacterium]
MKKLLFLALAPAALLSAANIQDKMPPTPQIQRGRELFMNSPRGTACKTCHQVAGLGTAIAPDMTAMASYGSIHSLVMTMHMKMTDNVLRFKTSAGNFPGIVKLQNGALIEVYDLSKTPPVLRTLNRMQIISMDRDDQWKHPPATANYSQQELADIIAFLRWATTGAQTEIAPAEIDPAW